MKLFACLLLAIGIVVGLAAHKPTAMAMAVGQASQSAASVELVGSAEEAGKSVPDADIVDAGHCFTPEIVADARDAATASILAMAWIPRNDGVEGREPSNFGRPPNLA